MNTYRYAALFAALFFVSPLYGQSAGSADTETDFSALKLRNIGPAFTSGRIADIAMHPDDDNVWYVAVGSGGVWRTRNAGTSWTSLFDGQSSYSVGAIAIDPRNPHVIWVGTGENVGGRHVAYGDGVYKSVDGGETWTNMGLEESRHISRIIVHPDNSDVIWVAAQGPLWNPGGERGIYKSSDGGNTWKQTLGDDEWVGATDLVMDSRNPAALYAATWQRHRNVAVHLGGGPGSGIHKSTDGGETWTETRSGIPDSNLGKIGLAISYHNPDHIYAAIELDRRTGGVFMSRDRGGSWTKMSDAVAGATGPHYYQELYTTPHAEGRLYLMDVRVQFSDDHGSTFRRLSEADKHSDNHAIAFRANDPDYILMGTDGGLFETFDDAETWHFIANLPVTQYYKVAVDDALPFYNVYGGTQDNGSHGGPSRTDNVHGIRNADWFKTLGADGHQSATEPGNPNVMYAEAQQGRLHRIDRITGEQVLIQPQARAGEKYERYNWDAPIVVSPHSASTIYFGSYRVWKSENRGNSWQPISADLTRDQERLELPVMGRVQSWDNAWDVSAMSVYNTITSIAVSPLDDGLIYAGTDDGLIHVTEDGGTEWRRIEVGSIPGIPATSFVNNLVADLHDADVVYAALDNHKFGDLSPYLVKSSDRGQTWESIQGNLPDRTLVWRLVQDHVRESLLFAATEFGLYFTVDGGTNWTKIASDATISFRDVTIQRRENDLVGASFGRGFFILDDYAPLREISEDVLAREGAPLCDQNGVVVPAARRSRRLARDELLRRTESGFRRNIHVLPPRRFYDTRRQAQKARKRGRRSRHPVPGLGHSRSRNVTRSKTTSTSSWRDAAGDIAGRVSGPASKGLHRVTWSLRYPSMSPVSSDDSPDDGDGFLATPGSYMATLRKTSAGVDTELGGPVEFEVVPLHEPALKGASPESIAAFRKEMETLQARVSLFRDLLEAQKDKVGAMHTALKRAARPSADLVAELHAARETLLALNVRAFGYESKSEIGERNQQSAVSRIFVGMQGLANTYGPTDMHRSTVADGKAGLDILEAELDTFVTTVVPTLEAALSSAGAPPLRME